MASGWIEPFVHTYGLFGLGLDVFLEAMGAPLPGETLLLVASGLAASGLFDIRAVMLVAFFAAALGDNVGYLIGRRFGRPFVLSAGARVGITEARLNRVEQVLEHRGAWIVVFARFVPFLRQLNGLAAGTVGMHWLRFVAANALGAALWVGVWSWAAFRLGAEADLMPAIWDILHRFAWILIPLWIAVYVVGWLVIRSRRRE